MIMNTEIKSLQLPSFEAYLASTYSTQKSFVITDSNICIHLILVLVSMPMYTFM